MQHIAGITWREIQNYMFSNASHFFLYCGCVYVSYPKTSWVGSQSYSSISIGLAGYDDLLNSFSWILDLSTSLCEEWVVVDLSGGR